MSGGNDVMCGVPVNDGQAMKLAIRNEFLARYGNDIFEPAAVIRFAYTRMSQLNAGEFTETEYLEKWSNTDG